MINEGLAENFATWIYGEEILGPWVTTEIATAQEYFPEGLPFCAGYSCGYYMIKYFLEKTGKSIIEASLMPYAEIKKDLYGFWKF
ncbi:DUF2268 domain-containing putative Zn-dependent protease [Terrisporobacter sp.]